MNRITKQKERLLWAAVIFLFAICCLFTYAYEFVLSEYRQIHKRMNEDSEGTHLYFLFDNFLNDEWDKLVEDARSTEKLMTLNTLLHQNQEINFFELLYTPIYINDRDYKADKTFYYYDGVKATEENNPVTGVKALFVDSSVKQLFPLQTQNGAWFAEEDYSFERAYQSGTVPLILGAGYQEYYQTGDRIEIVYLGLTLDAVVLDFFNPSSELLLYPQMGADRYPNVSLDTFVVAPLFVFDDISADKTVKSFQWKRLMDKNQGYLFSEYNLSKTTQLVEQLCMQAGFTPYIVYNEHFDSGYNLQKNKEFLLKAMPFFLLVWIGFSVILTVLLRRYIKRYSFKITDTNKLHPVIFRPFLWIVPCFGIPLLSCALIASQFLGNWFRVSIGLLVLLFAIGAITMVCLYRSIQTEKNRTEP